MLGRHRAPARRGPRSRAGGQRVVGRVADLLQGEAARRQHRHRRSRGPDASSSAASQARSRRPSATATSAPTSERTIEWQKASARTVTSTTPGQRARRDPLGAEVEQRTDGRRALAPPAERGEVVQPEQVGHHRGQPVEVERAGDVLHEAAQQRVADRPVVGEAVDVAPPDRREAGVEARRGLPHRGDDEVRREHPAQPPRELLGRARRRRRAGRGARPGRGRARRRRSVRRRPGSRARRAAARWSSSAPARRPRSAGRAAWPTPRTRSRRTRRPAASAPRQPTRR